MSWLRFQDYRTCPDLLSLVFNAPNYYPPCTNIDAAYALAYLHNGTLQGDCPEHDWLSYSHCQAYTADDGTWRRDQPRVCACTRKSRSPQPPSPGPRFPALLPPLLVLSLGFVSTPAAPLESTVRLAHAELLMMWPVFC